LVEHWNGTQWSVISAPNPGDATNELKGVSGVATNDVWAVGYQVNAQVGHEDTLILRWNGTQWLEYPSYPSPGTAYNELTAVKAIAANDVWAVGTYSDTGSRRRPLTMHWNGTQWSVIPTPFNPAVEMYLTSVAASSPDYVWAVGFYINPATNASANVGMRWDNYQYVWLWPASDNPGSHTNVISGVTAVGPNEAWAVGSYANADGIEHTMTLQWDQTRLRWVNSPSPYSSDMRLYSVDKIDSNNVWAVGSTEIFGSPPLTERWDGTQWRIVDAPGQTAWHYLLGVSVVPGTSMATGGYIWAVGVHISVGGVPKTLVERYNIPSITFGP
jgi:hypothetical protein